jgi:hypothetical protein
MDSNAAALKALKDIGQVIRDYLPPSCEITAEEAMEEIVAIMDRNSVARLARGRVEHCTNFAQQLHGH